MKVYRITRKRYEKHVLNGEGGRKVASRWNYKGDPITYTSATRALSLLEMLVHMDMEDMRKMDLVICEITIPETVKVQTIPAKSLPEGWQKTPFSQGPQAYWHAFIQKKKAAVLRVPSIIIPQEWNYLIDPMHEQAGKIKVNSCSALSIDSRF